jgi:hypothetical protein
MQCHGLAAERAIEFMTQRGSRGFNRDHRIYRIKKGKGIEHLFSSFLSIL